VLRATLGVPIVQEQVMQLAIVAAGFRRGERKAAPRDGGLEAQRQAWSLFQRQLIDGLRGGGIPRASRTSIHQIYSASSEYGFPGMCRCETLVVDADTGSG